MDLGTVFKLSLYGLLAVVGVILGAAESEGNIGGNAHTRLMLSYLSLPIVICGYLFTERRLRSGEQRGSGLGALWANSLGIIALAATAFEFNSENKEGKLLAGTHLLLYATWIVLFQKKTIRSYWFLMALGILQLAIASVLTRSGWFGFSAVVYTFGAVWTLSIFSLWRAETLFEETNLARSESRLADGNGLSNTAEPYRQPVSEVRGAVQHEDGTQWLTTRFISGVLMTTLSALIVSALFFAFIPRVWVGPDFAFQDDRSQIEGLGRKTGLATSVRLGDLGPVLESSERVFDIQLSNFVTKQPITVQSYAELLGLAEPLFRGAVLTKYERGRWSTDGEVDSQSNGFERVFVRTFVRQDIRLEQSNTHVLFCLGKPLKSMDSTETPVGSFNESTGVLSRGETGALDYSVYSRLPSTTQPNFKLRIDNKTWLRYQDTDYLEHNTELPPGLSELKKLAREIVERETTRRNNADPSSPQRELTSLEKAEALEFYLRESGEYRYSMDIAIQDVKRDPVEDFLFNRKKGHCEYFASALTLMLRAVDIPARIVSGYKGGYENTSKRSYSFEVQQKYSHLWSEAWVDSSERRDRSDRFELGWTTFDATPIEDRISSIAEVAPKKPSVWSDMQSTLSGLWSENVLNMSLARQEESIYKPLRELGYGLVLFFRQLFTSPESALDTFWNLIKNRDQWFSIGGGMFVFFSLAFAAGFFWICRFSVKRISAWWRNRAKLRSQKARRVVAFYERFAKLAQLKGLKRAATQTQLEFAEQVATDCLPALSEEGLAHIPEQISQFYYRVRFGDENLSSADLTQLDQVLTKLEHAISAGRSTSNGESQLRRT